MNPDRTNAYHDLHSFGERPRFLEQQVSIPFGRVMGVGRRDTSFKFQPVLYWRHFNRYRRADARSTVFEIPTRSYPKLDDCDRLLLNRLRESGSGKRQGKMRSRRIVS
jgi:hypothetical protein